MNFLEAKNLTKDYGNGRGIFDFSMELNPGEIVGFLGPNGAGKSTTLNILNGLINPDSGTFYYFGQEQTSTTFHRVAHRVGIMLSDIVFEKNATPTSIFREFQLLNHSKDHTEWRQLADHFELPLTTPFSRLSLGNRKKVGLICTLLNDPEIILMDEPTSGLDPLIQQKFARIINDKKSQGVGILLSSHVLSEVESICDRIIMIKNGKQILSDTKQNILQKQKRKFVINNPTQELVGILQAQKEVINFSFTATQLIFFTDEYESIISQLNSYNHYDYFVERTSLEESFVELYQ